MIRAYSWLDLGIGHSAWRAGPQVTVYLPPRTKGAGMVMGLCCTEHSSMYEEVVLSLSTTKIRGGSGGELARQEGNQSWTQRARKEFIVSRARKPQGGGGVCGSTQESLGKTTLELNESGEIAQQVGKFALHVADLGAIPGSHAVP